MTIKYLCDVCKQEITGKVYDIRISSHRDVYPLFLAMEPGKPDYIICEQCINNIFRK